MNRKHPRLSQGGATPPSKISPLFSQQLDHLAAGNRIKTVLERAAAAGSPALVAKLTSRVTAIDVISQEVRRQATQQGIRS